MPQGRDHVFHRDWRKTFPMIGRGEGVYLYDRQGKRYLDEGDDEGGSCRACLAPMGVGSKAGGRRRGRSTRACLTEFDVLGLTSSADCHRHLTR